MAEVNMAQALNSPSYAEKCWRNFYLQKNTMNISATEMGQIEAAWSDRLGGWKERASRDVNQYEITDDVKLDNSLEKGKKEAEKATEYKNSTGDKAARGAKHAVTMGGAIVSAYGAVAGVVGEKALTKGVVKLGEEAAKKAAGKAAQKAVEKGTGKFLEKATSESVQVTVKEASGEVTKNFVKETSEKGASLSGKAASKQATELGTNAAKDGAKSTGCIIGCTMAFATGLLYQTTGPNRKEHKALEKAKGELANKQSETADAQAQMETMNAELVEAADEANSINEDANVAIEDTKTKYDFYKASYDELKVKAESGEALTNDEKDLYKSTVEYMQEAGASIEQTSEDASDQVTGVHDNMAEYQEGFDSAAETVANIEGFTDELAGYDKSTEIMCYVEAGSQGLNAASGGIAAAEAFSLASSGAWAFGATAWAYAFAALGLAGAGMSGAGVAEQIKYGADVHKEIDIREATQDLNAATAEAYDVHIEDYASYMENVEGLELEIPDDVEAPEAAEVPAGTNASTTAEPAQQPKRKPQNLA